MSLPTFQDYFPFVLKHGDSEKTIDQYLELIMADMEISISDQEIKNTSTKKCSFPGPWIHTQLFS